MKQLILLFFILPLLGCSKEAPVPEETLSPVESPGVSLRQMILTTPVSELGFAPDADFPTVYGVLTDWNLGDTTVTIMALRDGSASLYTTAAFGIIGGHEHARVRKAALRYVGVAEGYAGSCTAVTDFPYPQNSDVYFYLLTYDGVQRCVGEEGAIRAGTDPTHPLFAAAQDVLTELRLIAQSK
jgi:hypothetical protein